MVHVELTPRAAAAGTVETLLGMGIDRELAEKAVRPPSSALPPHPIRYSPEITPTLELLLTRAQLVEHTDTISITPGAILAHTRAAVVRPNMPTARA